MRTHIRMHLDKKSGDFNEENYISCILDDDSTEIPPAAANKATPSPETVDKSAIKSPVTNGSTATDSNFIDTK